jgi:hypothetical protein
LSEGLIMTASNCSPVKSIAKKPRKPADVNRLRAAGSADFYGVPMAEE